MVTDDALGAIVLVGGWDVEDTEDGTMIGALLRSGEIRFVMTDRKPTAHANTVRHSTATVSRVRRAMEMPCACRSVTATVVQLSASSPSIPEPAARRRKWTVVPIVRLVGLMLLV